MSWAVYLLTNEVNGKGYVGITSKDLDERWERHVLDSYSQRRGSNGRVYALYAAIKKYGEAAFSIETIEDGLTLQDAQKREGQYIRQYGTYASGRGGVKNRRGYNMSFGGEEPDETYY
jgi:group I intron endonuclease